jgi:Homoserine dehydrogenase, NAD binding domain
LLRLSDAHAAILEDDSINCVIELMGGVTHAKDVVFKAIAKGKHVITANKALLAQYLPEVQQLLAANPKVRLGYEAAVCGGIPIINALQQDFLGDDITKVSRLAAYRSSCIPSQHTDQSTTVPLLDQLSMSKKTHNICGCLRAACEYLCTSYVITVLQCVHAMP